MFERRLKIFLALLVGLTVTLVLRAAQLQVVQHDDWTERAAETMKRTHFIETFRGKVLDVHGRPIAVDEPCVDACVDYRVIPQQPDEKWVLLLARKRLRERLGTAYTQAPVARQAALRSQEVQQVKADIDAMWAKLAAVSGQTIDDIGAIRTAIVRRVEMRRKFIWYRNYELAKRKHERERKEDESSWRRWLLDETKDAPRRDDFEVTVAEQTEPHVILRNIDVETQNELGVYIENYPGLTLQPSTHRYYPYGEAGCHLIGRLSKVNGEDLKRDPNVGRDELRQYLPNDLIGRSGVEALCEPLLRGTRGRVERLDGREVGRTAPVPGRDVRLTIDVELQQEVQRMFQSVQFKDSQGNIVETIAMHGAAVVIDVPTGGVRVLASYPDFDLNHFDKAFAVLGDKHNIERPLFNRATQAQLEPGSTIKPIVGFGAIADALIEPTHGIECTGYLVINGRRIHDAGRCWTASKFAAEFGDEYVAHHKVPSHSPHKGHSGNPDGFLAFDDAIERSCNVYFETLADRLGLDGMSRWYERFGLGRPTGLGIPEVSGRLPDSFKERAGGDSRKFATWMSGIGQGPVAATPIQMANVAATIARDGVWVRPRLVDGDQPPKVAAMGPDRVDLKLPPEAIRVAKEGMIRVVNSRAGTGKEVRRDDVTIAGKTGTAEASRQLVPMLDENRRLVLDQNGKPRMHFAEPSTVERPNPDMRWYHGAGKDGKKLNHAWFIGFAPAENPKIAFAVMVEYGVSGGATAGGLAARVLEACIEHGYLPLERPVAVEAAAVSQ